MLSHDAVRNMRPVVRSVAGYEIDPPIMVGTVCVGYGPRRDPDAIREEETRELRRKLEDAHVANCKSLDGAETERDAAIRDLAEMRALLQQLQDMLRRSTLVLF
jgi:hypothetical protein